MKRWVSLAAAVVAVLPAHAAPVPIVNAGFETPVLADKGSVAAPGWSDYDPTSSGTIGNGLNYGTYNPPVAAYPEGVPDGSNTGWFYNLTTVELGMQQTLAATIAPSTRYTLRVQVGDPIDYDGFGLAGFPGYRIELAADAGGPSERVLASDANSLSIPEGTFWESVITYNSPASGDVIGKAITIRLIGYPGPGIEADFDDVRLDASPLPPDTDGPSITRFERLTATRFLIEWISQDGASYDILGSDTLTGFTKVAGPVSASGPVTSFTFSDPLASGAPRRFYRIGEPP